MATPQLPSQGSPMTVADDADAARSRRAVAGPPDHHEGVVLNLRRRRSSTPGRRTAGQSLVEFALVFPLFILLVAGMVDFGLGLYNYMTVNNAVRDGARLGATACSALACTNAVKARVTAASNAMVSPSDVTVTCAKAGGGAVPCTRNTTIPPTAQNGAKTGDSVTVRAQFTYHMVWPIAFGTPITLTSSATYMTE
jgi:Flp pilus assembly protein TadG